MSYYGYPNPQAYNAANYQAYAAAYAASGTYDQYQAAYNAAAYRAMQPSVPGQQAAVPPPPPPPSNSQTQSLMQTQVGNNINNNSKPSVSISQPAQRYDYSLMQSNTSASYDTSSYAPNMMNPMQQQQQQNRTQPNQAKWNSMVANNKKSNQFQRRGPRNPNSQSVQIFYCEVCKISCAGPQTYKEHLEGQKHKKRELANKTPVEQPPNASNGTNDTNSPNQTNSINNTNSNWKQNNRNRNQPLQRPSLVIKCELCDVACTGRDAYLAHVRGMKHQKTLKLHQKLGKPIPPDALDIINAAANVVKTHTPTTTISAPVAYPQPSLVPPPPPPPESDTTNTTPATNLVMNIPHQQQVIVQQPKLDVPPQADDLMDQEDQINIEPIGREYIETRYEGKILSFYCKLCECQFNDPNAKDMHTKGRRHRLAYKKKVDPSLRVDMKSNGSGMQRSNNKISRERPMNMRRNLSQVVSPNDSLNQINTPLANAPSLTSNGTPSNGTQSSSTTSNIMPLMSANLTESAPTALTQQPTQTIQQLMSQPLKAPSNWNTNMNYSMQQTNQVRQGESFDDRHIIAKHNMIYPSQEEINAIHEIVNSTEKALKLVSDQVAEEDMAADKKTLESQQIKTEPDTQNTNTTDNQTESSSSSTNPTPNASNGQQDTNQMYRALKGVMRVGLLAKGLLLKGDTDVQLVVLCADKPTKRLLERVHTILLEKIDIVSPLIKYSVILDRQAETIVIVKTTISDLQPLITCKVVLTSPAVRTFSEQLASEQQQQQTDNIKTELTNINNNNEENDDLLDKQRCLDSLAALRHSKWFQARASNVTNCVIIIRILRDLCRRNPTWTPLSQWGLELLVERSLSSSNQTFSPGEALRRVLECVSSGILLPSGPGLYDPCEKDPADVADTLKNQQREELTASAQMALRLLAFKQIHKILGIECLSTSSQQQMRQARKRPNASTENEIEDKKGRLDSSEVSSSAAAPSLITAPTVVAETNTKPSDVVKMEESSS